MRREPADVVLAGATVLTMDPATPVLTDAAVAVRGGRVQAVGPAEELLAVLDTAEVVDVSDHLVMPAWVDAHAHLAMNIFRGAADDVTLEEFLRRMVAAERASLTADTVRSGVRAAVAELLLGGTTTALDMYWYPGAAQEVARESGFRLLGGPTFMEGPDPEGRTFEEVLASADASLAELARRDPAAPRWVMPHSTYTLGREQLLAVADLARRHEARIHVHASESPGEMELVAQRHGARPVQVLAETGLLGAGTVLAHAVHLDDPEIAAVAAAGAAVAHCPVSNLKLGCGVARLPELLDAGVTVALGTDGAASGGALDMLAAAGMAALLHKGVRRDPTAVSAEVAIRAGTVGGARAVGLPDLGVVAPGYRADLQVLRADGLEAVPADDPFGVVAYSLRSSAVVHTLSDGRFLVRDGRLTTLDLDGVREGVRAARRLVAAG